MLSLGSQLPSHEDVPTALCCDLHLHGKKSRLLANSLCEELWPPANSDMSDFGADPPATIKPSVYNVIVTSLETLSQNYPDKSLQIPSSHKL